MTGTAMGKRGILPRVLMISPQFHPIVGGYEQAALRLSSALVKRGVEVAVAAERRDKAWSAEEILDGVRVFRFPCVHRRGVHVISSTLSLMAFLAARGRDFDVWHVHQYGPLAAAASFMGILLRRPIVLKIMNTRDDGIDHELSRGRFPWLSRVLHKRVSAVAAVSRETFDEAVAFGISPRRVHILPNGVDAARFRPRSQGERAVVQEELGLSGKRVAVFLGRFSPQKNLEGLLRAWSLARPALGSEWVLVLVGDGPLHDEIAMNIERSGLSGSVRAVGATTEAERWLGAADIAVLSSDFEGLSNFLLEAMACGLPTISTRVSGATELLEDSGAGEVVETGDMQAFAVALERLAASPGSRAQMGALARALIERVYDVDVVAQKFEMMYRRVIEEGR